MFYNLRQFYELTKDDVFNHVPITFHIQNGTQDKEYKNFLKYFHKRQKMIQTQEKEDDKNTNKRSSQQGHSKKVRNIWIVKPGEITNRGTGITVCENL